MQSKVEKFLDSYIDILEEKVNDNKTEAPSLIDLSMYLIMMEILLHLLGHKESIAEEAQEKHLVKIPFSLKSYSWSEYIIQFIGLFTRWSLQKRGFKDMDSNDYRLKLDQYRAMAFKTNLSALSILTVVNQGNDLPSLNEWRLLDLLNSNLVFNPTNGSVSDTEEFLSFIPQTVIDEIGEGIIEDEIQSNIGELELDRSNRKKISIGDFYHHEDLGYTLLDKIIENPKNTFYKLFRPGFEWDEQVNDYWNGHVYSIKEKRWLKSRVD